MTNDKSNKKETERKSQTKLDKMLSYRTETARQGVL